MHSLQPMDSQPRFVSLYSGAGGLDQGFVDAGFVSIWANDFDPDAVETYRENIGAHIHLGDVSEALDFDSLKSLAPDVVIGGPPCQGFSVAGHMKPDDPRSKHVSRFMDIVGELSPDAFVMENVAALALNRRWESLLDRLKRKARRQGFRVRTFVLNASHYEVPQARLRMFLVGVKETVPVKPKPVTDDAPPTVGNVLAELPAFGSPGNDSLCTARVTPARKPVLRRSPFAGMLFNGKGRPLDLTRPAGTLPASMGGNRTPIIDQWLIDGHSEVAWVVGYHSRLMSGRPPVKRIPKRMRRLTVEEAAALQTFPEWWKFSGRRSAQYRQIGNAVPPKLAFHVAASVRNALGLDQPSAELEAPALLELAAA
jgi:DNA (cytosine-5)-methyltransferase 1